MGPPVGPDGMGLMTETAEPRWKTRPTRHMAEIFADDQERLNALVARLNSGRPGRHRQKDAIRYLLDLHDQQKEETAP